MINKECFTTEWIAQKSTELQYNDKNLIEKVIRAFSLLEMLSASGCPFHFKGGTSFKFIELTLFKNIVINLDVCSERCTFAASNIKRVPQMRGLRSYLQT